MPYVELEHSRFHYRLDGPANASVLVLSNSLGTDLTMWDPQMAAFTRRFRVLRYDTRGHGQSLVTPGPYTIQQLSGDVVALLDALQITRANFCGLSMGGATGMWLATNASQRFDKIILCNTAARIGTPEFWYGRIRMLRQGGLPSIVDSLMQRWFTEEFRENAPLTIESLRKKLESMSTPGYIACCEALRDNDQRTSVSMITNPTLIIAGTRDIATTPEDGRFIADRIRGSQYVEFDAAHLSNIESPVAFTRTVEEFLLAE
jgi:3-oxoadipate enol-lactonase